MEYKNVLKAIKEYVIDSSNIDTNFSYLSCNSKDIKENTLFICKGITFKEEYLKESIKKGVNCYISEIKYNVDIPYILVSDIRKTMAILSAKFFPDNLFKIAVTGTKGKTTTTTFIHNILNNYTKSKTGYISTIDLYTGKRHEESHNTTPESIDLHKYLNEMQESNIKYMCMEVSSQAEKQNRIFGMSFDIGAFLNIGLDHISELEHKDFNDYFSCKLNFLKKCKKVFIYRQEPRYEEIVKEVKDKEIITFGFTKDCNYYVKDIVKENGITFTVISNKEETYHINMLGNFNIINALCAIAIAKELNIDYKDIKKGLEETKVLGRMNIFKSNTTVIVDYAHNALSAENFYKSVKEDFKNKKIKVVFGCPGDRGINRREEMGTLAGLYADYIYLTSEDPQTKDPNEICKEISKYIEKYNKPYEIIIDRKTAIEKAIESSDENDLVAVLGKGDEEYQLINNKYVYYESDIKVVENTLNKIKE